MRPNHFKIRAEVWLYPGPPEGGGRWHFITVPGKQSGEIKKRFGKSARGWGSLPVTVTILRSRRGQVGPTSPRLQRASNTSWKTSIFPDKKSGTYLLPLKAEVRKKERISNGDTINFLLEIKS